MKLRPPLLPAILLLLTATGLNAQKAEPTPTPKPSPPPGPLIQKRAPDFASWVISIRLPGDATSKEGAKEGGPAAPDKKSETDAASPQFNVIKTGTIYHVRLRDGQKQVWDVWTDGKLVATELPQGKGAELVAPPSDRDSSNPLYVNFSKSDFEGFEWISADNYQGIKPVLGKPCLVFSANVIVSSEPVESDGKPAPEENADARIAYVDAETRLPVALSSASGISSYRFLPPPDAMQTFPQSILDLVNKERRLNQSLSRRPGLPF